MKLFKYFNIWRVLPASKNTVPLEVLFGLLVTLELCDVKDFEVYSCDVKNMCQRRFVTITWWSIVVLYILRNGMLQIIYNMSLPAVTRMHTALDDYSSLCLPRSLVVHGSIGQCIQNYLNCSTARLVHRCCVAKKKKKKKLGINGVKQYFWSQLKFFYFFTWGFNW